MIMRVYDLILKKRKGRELSPGEITWLVGGYVRGEIPDYQVSAFLMAVYFQGMTPRETRDLTLAMARSGEVLDLSSIPGTKVDKHSTGGVGDKTTLVLLPLLAAAGVPVVKMAGQGLGHTGGTIDKLQSIPGFNPYLRRDEMMGLAREKGLVIAAQTGWLVPADRKLYALRDVTATVDSIPLIASSIMSKKYAAGAGALALDVKAGKGAFLKETADAFQLARAMVDTGNSLGIKTVALVTAMDQPLGKAVGNALEVREAFQALQGEGPRDLLQLSLALGSALLQLAGKAGCREEGEKHLQGLIASGKAWEKLGEMVASQGGDPRVLQEPGRLLPQAAFQEAFLSPGKGYLEEMDALKVGLAAQALGAGREKIGDPVDPAVGIVLQKKVGDPVDKGEPLLTIHSNHRGKAARAREILSGAYLLTRERPPRPPLVLGREP